MSKFCAYCQIDSHNDDECHRTRPDGWRPMPTSPNLIASIVGTPTAASVDVDALKVALHALEKLDKRPRPMCRDCADNDGTCPNRDGLPCDMPAAIARAWLTMGALERAAARQAPAPQPSPVYLVATGETHDDHETYTRHDARPPLCDAETLYTAAQPLQAAGVEARTFPREKLLQFADQLDPLTRKGHPDNLTLGCAAKALRAAAPEQAAGVEAIGMRDATYVDSTPRLHVGNSAFEDWFQAQPFATQSGIKQIARDSYAAGMGDPLVTYATAPEQAAQPVAEALSQNYVQTVPDRCDRIVWRNRYYHLPLAAPIADTAPASTDALVKAAQAVLDTHKQMRVEWSCVGELRAALAAKGAQE